MNRLAICAAIAAVWLAASAYPAGAQTKTITGESKSITVSVEAIEQSRRELTVKKPDGTYEVFTIPATMKRFDTLKIGDKIRATFYENMVLQLKQPGDKAVNTGSAGVTPSDNKSGVTSARQRTITATIAAIDPAVPSITFTGPNGWKYSGRVQDKSALAKVKVGDRLDITWTEALLLTIDEPK